MIADARPVIALALCLLAGCATGRPPAPQAASAVVRPATPGDEIGVIVAERPLQPRAAGDVRATILATLGDAAVTAALAQIATAEFIVREADGATLSVVQDNPQHLRPGERVAIERRPQTMLVRALSDAPGG